MSKGPFQPGDQWVAEKRLPLWLIKAFEESARRAAMAAAADAARRAARGEPCDKPAPANSIHLKAVAWSGFNGWFPLSGLLYGLHSTHVGYASAAATCLTASPL